MRKLPGLPAALCLLLGCSTASNPPAADETAASKPAATQPGPTEQPATGPATTSALPAKAPDGPATAPSAATATAQDPTGALAIPHDMPPLDAPCETRVSFVTDRIRRAANAGHDRACAVDADCTAVHLSTECQGSCTTVVHTAHAVAFNALRDALDQRVCDGYRSDGCSYLTPRCMNLVAVCKDARCAQVPPTK